MSTHSRKIALVFGMTSAIRHNGASLPTGSTAISSIRSRGAKTTGLMMFGYRSTTSSKTGIFPRSCPQPRRSPSVPNRSVPFHNPVRLAEDIATVDVISGGRFELGVGVGFKLEEFESFGVPFKGARSANQPISRNNSPRSCWGDRYLQE